MQAYFWCLQNAALPLLVVILWQGSTVLVVIHLRYLLIPVVIIWGNCTCRCGLRHEQVLQFGYVSMFAVVFPLAPLFAILNNVWEFKLDLGRLVKSRRPHVRLFIRTPEKNISFLIVEIIMFCSTLHLPSDSVPSVETPKVFPHDSTRRCYAVP